MVFFCVYILPCNEAISFFSVIIHSLSWQKSLDLWFYVFQSECCPMHGLITQKPRCPPGLLAPSSIVPSVAAAPPGLARVPVTRSFSTGKPALWIWSRSAVPFGLWVRAAVSCSHLMGGHLGGFLQAGTPRVCLCRTCSVTGPSTGEDVVPSEPLGGD